MPKQRQHALRVATFGELEHLLCQARRQRLGVPGSARLLPPYVDLRRVWVARADATGGFSMGTPAADDAQLAVRALGYAGRDVPLAAAMNAEIAMGRSPVAETRTIVTRMAIAIHPFSGRGALVSPSSLTR